MSFIFSLLMSLRKPEDIKMIFFFRDFYHFPFLFRKLQKHFFQHGKNIKLHIEKHLKNYVWRHLSSFFGSNFFSFLSCLSGYLACRPFCFFSCCSCFCSCCGCCCYFPLFSALTGDQTLDCWTLQGWY